MGENVPQLTTGIFLQIASSASPQDPVWSTSPIVQVLQAKPVEKNGKTRWRLLISDGTHILQALAAPHLNTLFEDGHAGKGSVVRVHRFMNLGPPVDGRRQVTAQIDIIPTARRLNRLSGWTVLLPVLKSWSKKRGRSETPLSALLTRQEPPPNRPG